MDGLLDRGPVARRLTILLPALFVILWPASARATAGPWDDALYEVDSVLSGSWSAYVVGAGIGVLCWLAFLFLDRPIGCSTAFTRTAGMLESLAGGQRTKDKAYYQKFVPCVDWEVMLVLGVLVGAFISALAFGRFKLSWVPGVWDCGFWETGAWCRLLAALVGGFLMGFGARWAGGCTSGHGISGSLQLSVGSWISTACFFAAGIVTAKLIYWGW